MSNFITGRNFGSNIQTSDIADDAVSQDKLADQIVNEARMQISNSPTNGYFLSAQSGNTGGMTWAELSSFTFTEVAAQATTSGTSVDFSIPSGAKRFTVLLNGVSNSGNSSAMGVQLGDSGGIETTGYGVTAETIGGYEHDTGMFQICKADQTDHNLNWYGLLTFETLNGSSDLTWIGNGNYGSSSVHRHGTFGGYKTISAELTTVRFKTDGTFDAGSVSLRWAPA
tara:strand:- start:101 stop:778 length:678 start_codon:yes stop_codon:yes gene_type:complete